MGKQTGRNQLLETLAAYVTHGTMAAAAKSLGISRYTVWNRLAVLEGRVGLLLLRSDKRPISRTPVLNKTGKRLLNEWKETKNDN